MPCHPEARVLFTGRRIYAFVGGSDALRDYIDPSDRKTRGPQDDRVLVRAQHLTASILSRKHLILGHQSDALYASVMRQIDDIRYILEVHIGVAADES